MSLIIAHRGLSSEAFENTKEAFILASQKEEVFAIETDIWLTKDNCYVCCHEPKPFINSNIDVTQITHKEATLLKLNPNLCKFKFNKDAYICSFLDYLQVCNIAKKVAVIEIKQKNLTKEAIQLLITMVKNNNKLDQVHFISFDFETLKIIKAIEKDAIVFGLVDKKEDIDIVLELNWNISIKATFLSRKLIRKFHDKKLLVSTWTLDAKLLILSAQALGVDFITTNKP